MLRTQEQPRLPRSRWFTLRITAIYAAVGALWIAFSDRLLEAWVSDPSEVFRLQTYKGWIYVGSTALLLAWLIRRHLSRLETEEATIRRLNRTHALLSGINGAIVRVRRREELLQITSELAVDTGHFLGARIFLHDAPGGPLIRVAQAGMAKEFPESAASALVARLSTPDLSKPLWINHLEEATLSTEWLSTARELGIRAMAALPIPDWAADQPTRGWLELYSGSAQTFDEEETLLLKEIAADIGLGLETIDKSINLHTLAYYDALTGLPNTALLTDHLQQTLARALHDLRAVGVVVIDCPELTRLGDVRGHQVGDRLRKELADYLTRSVRDGDTVARTGQDEFTVVLADMARTEDVVALSERLLAGPSVLLDDGSLSLQLPLRGGAAFYPGDGDTTEELLQRATLTLHIAAGSPGTCAFYSSRLNEVAQTQLKLEHELMHAIERNELSVVYQPVVDAKSQHVTCAEALMRWQSGALGDVSPGIFIPIAESCGLIHSLGRWVLEEVCRQIAAWRAAGFADRMVSVNVSAPQLLRTGFVAELQEVLRLTGLSNHPAVLAIEVTETSFMENVGRAADILSEIRALGVRIFLDDFGTGYSSLSYLSQLPIDVVKIDYSFVAKLPDDPRAVSLVKAVIALAHSLGLQVVAEGVEAQDQFQLLNHLGCDRIQGYLFGRPVGAEQITALIGHHIPPGDRY